MTDRPILFSAPMVRALLAGTKTQTRRALRKARVFATPEVPAFTLRGAELERALQNADRFRRVDGDGWFWESDAFDWQAPAARTGWFAHIGYAPGDRLWVRESWRTIEQVDGLAPREISASRPIFYEADDLAQAGRGKLRSSIHMPRWASRLTLGVTEVRVQRLQDISEADALAEGIVKCGSFYGVAQAEWDHDSLTSAVDAYANLWDSINGAGAWDANPWVSATSFTVHHQSIDTIQVLPARYGERSTPTPEEERRLFAFEHNGVRIYHCLRWCGQIVRQFAYATDPRGIHEDEGDHSFMFDIRDQPGGKALEKAGGCRKLHEAVIRAALDAGPLVMIDAVPLVMNPNASPPPASKPVSSIWDDGEVPF